METEIETIELENGKLYAKVTEVVIDNIKYFFLVNSKDTYDYVIRKEVGEALEGAKGFIRGQLSQRVDIRHTPELKFIFDKSIEYGNKIEKIIKEIHEE